MPRVTEVLDYLTEPELLNWIENNSKAKRKAIQQEALRVGSAVDLLVREDILDGGYLIPEGDISISNCMKAWETFKKDYPLFVSSISKEDMQRELREEELIGRPDFPIKRDAECGMYDLKCSSSIRPKYWTQTAKYLSMWNCDLPKRFIGILRLDKNTGLYEVTEIADIEFINYEQKVFEAYYIAFNHAMKTREQLRTQLEREVLNVS